MKAKFFETTIKEAQLNLGRIEKYLQTFENSNLPDCFKLYLEEQIKQPYDSCKNEVDKAIEAVNNGDMSTLRLNWYPNRWHTTPLIHLGGLRESFEEINTFFGQVSEIIAYNGDGVDIENSWWGWTLPLEGMKPLPFDWVRWTNFGMEGGYSYIGTLIVSIVVSVLGLIVFLACINNCFNDDFNDDGVFFCWLGGVPLVLVWIMTGLFINQYLKTQEAKKHNFSILKQFAQNYLSAYTRFAESIHSDPNAPIEWLKP